MAVPVATITRGLMTTMGMTYPGGSPPVGTFIVEPLEGGATEEVEVQTCGSGPWLRQVERDPNHYPMIHVDWTVEDVEERATVKSRLLVATFHIFFSQRNTDPGTIVDNPWQNIVFRANYLRRLVDTGWKTLNTDPEIVCNADVGAVTLDNPWEEWNRDNDKRIYTAMFPVLVAVRELMPEVS